MTFKSVIFPVWPRALEFGWVYGKRLSSALRKNMLYNLCIFSKNRIDRNLQLDFKINTFQIYFGIWLRITGLQLNSHLHWPVWLKLYDSYCMTHIWAWQGRRHGKKEWTIGKRIPAIYLDLAGMLWRNDDVISEMYLDIRKKNI